MVVHLVTTLSELGQTVSKDASELVEFSWACVDAASLEVTHKETIYIKPTGVDIGLQGGCSILSADSLRRTGSFKDAVVRFDSWAQENIFQAKKEFCFITYDLAKLRVEFPREARDRGVVLPPYLQHPRVFDLQNEYSKWQVTHPEALSYSASSLSNIVTALEVDISSSDDDSSLSDSNSSTQVSSSGTSSATTASSVGDNMHNQTTRRQSAMTNSSTQDSKLSHNVDLYVKMLIQLVKKSLPVNEHTIVFTRPYDAAQDVKVFLAERSKILYLSNLLNDTTQSELESWFTQHGGRPIAFWTLKSFEANDSTKGGNVASKSRGLSGFAVFATHEDATESLAINGRALNDRAIEVLPSSTKVLDKASELLTPFPSSKNRPRPGDWTCPSCGFSNFQRRTACFRCSFPAASAVAIHESMFSNSSTGGRRGGGNLGAKGYDKMGYNNNSSTHTGINTNIYGNGFADMFGGDVHSNMHMNNVNVSGQATNNPYGGNRGYGNNVPFRAGDWKCAVETCQYHNFAKNLCCLRCGSAKPSNINSNANGNNVHHLTSVNSTAAAIAAATASGQSLNLSNGFMGFHQPQPHHANRYNQGHINASSQNGQRLNGQNGGYMNKSHLQMYHPSHGSSNLSNGNTPPQILQTQLMLLQQQQQQQDHHHFQPKHHSLKTGPQQKYAQSVTNSPNIYPGLSGNHYNAYVKGSVPPHPHSAPVGGSEIGTSDSNMPRDFNPSFNDLSNHLNSLNFNVDR